MNRKYFSYVRVNSSGGYMSVYTSEHFEPFKHSVHSVHSEHSKHVKPVELLERVRLSR